MEFALISIQSKTSSVLVSVILCNYNYEKYIGEAIESVLCQTHENLELIVVDDGSSDTSNQIINSYDDKRIIKLFQANGGQAAAFNSGFELCKGRLVAFLDSDDYWCSDKIEKCVKAFQSDLSLVQHNMIVVNIDSSIIGATHPGILPGVRNVLEAYYTEKHTGFFSATSGIVASREHLEKIFPLPTAWKICADVAITRPLPLWGDVLTLQKSLGYYRIHDSNNWMNSLMQKRTKANRIKYNAYTNEWLVKYGHPALNNSDIGRISASCNFIKNITKKITSKSK